MNPLDFTYEELEDLMAEKQAAWQKAVDELKEVSDLMLERQRLEKLKASLGAISADDMKAIQTLLGPSPIATEEDVRIP